MDCRAGIDKIELYNLKISEKSFDGFRTVKISDSGTTYSYGGSHFRLKVFRTDEKITTKINFNPNHVLTGENITNARGRELKKAVEKISIELRNAGIELDWSEARIGDVEINKNLPLEFATYSEAIFSCYSGEKNVRIISSGEECDTYSGMIEKRTVYYNRVNYDGVIYNKSKEVEERTGEKKEPITRFEWKFRKGYYKLVAEKMGYTNHFVETIESFEVVEKIFDKFTQDKWIKIAVKNIEKKIKPNLEKGFKEFKRTTQLQKKTGKKIQRDVLKYLENNYWIFDKSFLIQLMEKYNYKNLKREKERIEEKFSTHNNLKKFNQMSEFLFLKG